ncbi:protein EE17 [Proboscivirus elephantidbeta5]|uniref:Protein EE17 n=1 Tax=Elephant endotheliotropic herpesvirus 5 TaxID=768738 RepID=A0A075CZU3_9BETA|nr:protein EE17 [Elephant endotheliotropic herpesvirus 5]AHC02869.1 protein EE17 [Elephant endotheliotropic herpesvirus 5]
MLLILPMLVMLAGSSSKADSGSGSGDEDQNTTNDDEDYAHTTKVTNYLGVNYTEDNIFTPPPSFPPEAYNVSNEPVTELPPEPEDGFYIGSGGSGGGYSDEEDDDSLYEAEFLTNAFDLTSSFE